MPAKSKSQQQAAGAALAAKRGETSPSSLKGSSKEMYDSMSEDELRKFAKTKHKNLPKKVKKENRTMKITKKRLKEIIKEEVERFAYNLDEAGGGQVYDVFEMLKDHLGAEKLLDELYQAMSSDEAMANFEHIARMYDIDIGTEDEMGFEDDVPFEEGVRLSPDVVKKEKDKECLEEDCLDEGCKDKTKK
jgi:DNA-binding protein Fis